MADDKGNRGATGRSRINLNEDCEVRYRMEKFGCAAAQPRASVGAFGVSAGTVGRLSRHRK